MQGPTYKLRPRDIEPIIKMPANYLCAGLLKSQFRRAYNEALVDAIANEPDHDDWSELEALHAAQRRGTAKHGGRR